MIERLVSLAVLAGSSVYLANGWTLSMGTAARPGPGFFPLAVGVFGTSVALVWVMNAFRRAPGAANVQTVAAEGRWRVIVTASVLIGFCLLLPSTGYLIAAFLFASLLLRGLGARWTAALLIGLVSAVGSYYFFGVLLEVPLPRGLFLD